MKMKKPALAAAFVLATGAALAQDITAGALKLVEPFAFETPKMALTGGAFVKIVNTGSEADRLIGVRADYPKVEIHETVEKDGVARMQPAGAIDIPAGATLELKPGSYHIMFMGLQGDQRFEAGETVSATLIFEKAGAVTVAFPVRRRMGGMGRMQGMKQHGAVSD